MEIVFESTKKIVWKNKHGVRYEWTRWYNKPSPVRILRKDGQWKNTPKYFKSKSTVKRWAKLN